MIALTRELCRHRTGVVADGNEALFTRLQAELPFTQLRFPSGDSFNGWLVPQNWRVRKAEIRRDGRLVYDAACHALGVAYYSRSFQGRLDWEALKRHTVVHPTLAEALVFHCMWQYRPWDADWAVSVPRSLYRELGPGDYEVDLVTEYSPGEMIVAQHDKPGSSDRIIVFHSNNCHPHMANDGFAGTAVLVRLFQWLSAQSTRYTYRLVIGPEHLGTVFYLRDMSTAEMDRIVGGVFEEMPGTSGPLTVTSTFVGGLDLDKAFANAVRHHSRSHRLVPWRQGAGNDETVWEAPGYEVPFVEITRSEALLQPFREYHTDLDAPELMEPAQLEEMLEVLKRVVGILESNARAYRRFDGLPCLSNPALGLYAERADPAVEKDLPGDAEKWGYLGDCVLRYLDGSLTVLDIAERHGLPFEAVRAYLDRFAAKGLVDLVFEPLGRPTRPERRATLPGAGPSAA